MSTKTIRSHNCKDEELPVIGNLVLISFKRDLADFTAYSPKFNNEYATAFESKIEEVLEMVSPRSERAERKKISEHLYASIDALLTPLNRLSGYLTMANADIQLSATDFGIFELRKGIYSKDTEKVLGNLSIVMNNVKKYNEPLSVQGLNADLIAQFNSLNEAIAADKKRQYELLIGRKAIVQANLGTLGELNDLLTEIMNTGKILYKNSDQVKLQEYTFSELKKQVRHATKKAETETEGEEQSDTNA